MEKNTPTSKPLAVITGASSGIGLELAKQFALNGFDLFIASGSEGILRAERELTDLGAQVKSLQVDLATYDGVERLYDQVKTLGRPIDAIAINAGVGVGGDFTEETSLEAELELINLNVVSTVHLTKRVARDMVARGQGRILITSSIAATMPAPFEAVYGASKAFDLMFAESIRNELKDKGVVVTALMPGATDTNFFHRAGMDDTKVGAKEKNENDPADVAKQGFEALMAGKDHVIAASLKTKLQGLMARILPEPFKAEQHRKLSEPGSASDSSPEPSRKSA